MNIYLILLPFFLTIIVCVIAIIDRNHWSNWYISSDRYDDSVKFLRYNYKTGEVSCKNSVIGKFSVKECNRIKELALKDRK